MTDDTSARCLAGPAPRRAPRAARIVRLLNTASPTTDVPAPEGEPRAVDLYRFARVAVRRAGIPYQDREDVIAECIVAVLASTNYDPARGSFSSFVFWTMRAAVTAWWRSRQRREKASLDAPLYDEAAETAATRLTDENAGALDERIAQRALVNEFLAILSPKHRSLIVRRYFRDEPESAIARALGIRSVRGLAGYALAAMRASSAGQRAGAE